MRFRRFQLRIFFGFIIATILSALIYFSYLFVSDYIIDNVESNADSTASLFAGAMSGDLERHLIVPRILSRDDMVSEGLVRYNPGLDEVFERVVGELDRATLYMVSRNGIIINASDPTRKNRNYLYPETWVPALEHGNVNFFDMERQVFVTISVVEDEQIKTPLGILVMEVSFTPYPILWDRSDVDMMMVREDGTVLASRYPEDVGFNLRDLLGENEDLELTDIPFNRAFDYHGTPAYLSFSDLGINNWQLVYAVPSQSARQQINGIMALLVFLLGFMMLVVLYAFSRRAARQSIRLKRESEELRALNARLITEVEQRRQAEANLQSAEQTLEQSAKLAVIGQLSAAVGHELNQPLAAMRTYISTTRLLLKRARYFEAAQNINRIDDLVDRMSGITRQMRSFARAHENQVSLFDLKTSVTNAFELMSPQLGQMAVEIERDMPKEAVMVRGDQLRVEQILINLFRNALEAMDDTEDPKLQIRVTADGHEAHVYVIDSGQGIAQPDQLFESFYSTKTAGSGLGLGLAISASYARDMGGNLLARNNSTKGATFELILPRADATSTEDKKRESYG